MGGVDDAEERLSRGLERRGALEAPERGAT